MHARVQAQCGGRACKAPRLAAQALRSKQSLARPCRRPHIACDAASVQVEGSEVTEYTAHTMEFRSVSGGRFQNGLSSFTEQHRIRGYEVAPDQRTSVVSIANLMQEVAGNHAVGMWGRTDKGFANLPSMKDLIFVMTRLQIRIDEYPRWGDISQIETYFAEEGRLAARRDWVLTSVSSAAASAASNGVNGSGHAAPAAPAAVKPWGSATSTWVTINIANRKLSKLPDDMRRRFMTFTPQPARHALPPEEAKRKLPDFEMPAQLTGPVQVARRSDMDMNGHVNNVTYLAWTLETVPEDVYATHRLYEIEIDFKAECRAGDKVECLGNPLPDWHVSGGAYANGAADQKAFLHLLRRCDEGGCVELVRARTVWVPA